MSTAFLFELYIVTLRVQGFIPLATCGLYDRIVTDSSSLPAQKGLLSAAAGPNTRSCH